MGDIKAELYIDRIGRFHARIGKIAKTGHSITEDSGRFTVYSILTRGGLLCHQASRDQAEVDIGNEWAIFSAAHMPETSRDLDARFEFLRREQWIAELQLRNNLARAVLHPLLRAGDRLRADKAECGAREASFTFWTWDGGWILSKGAASISPASVYSINGTVFRV